MKSATWTNGISGDWSDAADWTPQVQPDGTTAVTIAAGGTYTIGVSSPDLAESVLLDAAGATLDLKSGGTLTSGTIALTGGILELDSGGVLSGGTIDQDGGGIDFNGGEAASVTVLGALGLTAAGAALQVAQGLTVLAANGSSPGTVALTGSGAAMTFVGTQSFDDATLDIGNSSAGDTLIASGALTLGPNAILAGVGSNFAGPVVQGGTLVNDGTIDLEANDFLQFALADFLNDGLIEIAAGTFFLLDGNGETWSSTGRISIAAGGLAVLQGVFDTEALAGVANQGLIHLSGTLDNAGTVLTAGAGGAGTVQLATNGTIDGGTVVGNAADFVLSSGPGTLAGVAFDGTLDLSPAGASLDVANGLTMAGIGGTGAGAIVLTGSAADLTFLTSGSLDNATISAGAATGWAVLQAATGAVATLGTDVTIDQTGSRFVIGTFVSGEYFTLNATGGEVVNDGTISAILGGFMIVDPGVFINAGEILVSGGTNLELAPGQFTNAASGTIAIGAGGTVSIEPLGFYVIAGTQIIETGIASLGTWTNAGQITVASGGSLAVNEVTSTAQLDAFVNNGGTITFDGTIDNAGSTITVDPGVLNMTVAASFSGNSDLQLPAVIDGGTIFDSGAGTLTGDGTLAGVTLAGTLQAAGGFYVAGGLGGTQANPVTVNNPTRNDLELFFEGSQTLANATFTGTELYAEAYDTGGVGATLTVASNVTVDTAQTQLEARSLIDSDVNLGTIDTNGFGASALTFINGGEIDATGIQILGTNFTNEAGGTISLAAGGTFFMFAYDWANEGQITIGAGAKLYLNPYVGQIAAGAPASSFTGLTNNGGTIFVTTPIVLDGQSLTLSGYNSLNQTVNMTIGAASTLGGIVFQGGTISGTGSFADDDRSDGGPSLIEANGGTLIVNESIGTLTEQGTLAIAADADLVLQGSANATIQFVGADGVLTLGTPSLYTGTLAGLAAGDMIDIVNATVTSASFNGTTLTIAESNGTVLNYKLAASLSGDAAQIVSDGAGGSDLMIGVAQPYTAFYNAIDTLSDDVSNLAPAGQVVTDALNVYATAAEGAIGVLGGAVWQEAFDNTSTAAVAVSTDLADNAGAKQLLSDTLTFYDSVAAGVAGAVASGMTAAAYQTLLGTFGSLAADISKGATLAALRTDIGNVVTALPGASVGSAAWQQTISDADANAAALSTDVSNGAAAATIQMDVAALYGTIVSDSLNAIGGTVLAQSYTGGNDTFRTLGSDIAAAAPAIQLQQDAAGTYTDVIDQVAGGDPAIQLQAFQTVIATGSILTADVIAAAGPGQYWFDTAGLISATQAGELGSTDGTAAEQLYDNAIADELQVQEDGENAVPSPITVLTLDTAAEADQIGFLAGTLSQTAFTNVTGAAETLNTDVTNNAAPSQVLSDALALFAQGVGEFGVFSGGASAPAYSAIVAAAAALNTDIEAGNAAALSADVAALIAASQSGEIAATNAAAWRQLSLSVGQPIAMLVAGIDSGAPADQILTDSGALYDALVLGAAAAQTTSDPELISIGDLPDTVAADAVAADTTSLLPDGLLLANELADPCGPLMAEEGPPLDKLTDSADQMDTLADLFNKLQKLFGGGTGAAEVPTFLDSALKSMKAAVTQLQNEAAFGQSLKQAGYFEADAAALVDAGIADATAGAAVGSAYVTGLETLAPFIAAGSTLDFLIQMGLNWAQQNPNSELADFFNNNPLGQSLAWFHQFLGPFFNVFNVFNPGLILKSIANLIQPQWGANEWPSATVAGDVHLVTFDGLHYDFQAAGEFILAQSALPGDTFQVQARMAPWFNSASVSVMTMIGAQIGTDRVTFGLGRSNFVWVDGAPVTLTQNVALNLNGGTLIELSPQSYELNWNTGESIVVTNEQSFLDLSASLGPAGLAGGVEGLMGPNQGQANDFELPNGTVLPQPLTSAELYGTFANAWRVTQADSLLDYSAGQTTATFTDPNFPADAMSIGDLPAAVVNAGAGFAAAAGITDPNIAADAELDYIATGDPDFITGDASLQSSIATTGATIEATALTPAAGVAAVQPTIVAAASGATPVVFDVYLTGTFATSQTIDYTMLAPGTGYFDASPFGGMLPSGQVTIDAGQTLAQFTIDLPAGALGALPSEILEAGISVSGNEPVFATTAQSLIANDEPVAGTPAVALLEDTSDPAALERNGNAYTLNLGTLAVGDMPEAGFAIVNNTTAPADDMTGGFTVSGGGAIDFSGATTFPALAPGQVYTGLEATANSGALGFNTETLTFTPEELNASGYSAALTPITLTIDYTVQLAAGGTIGSPSIINFGTMRAGASASQAISVTNTANAGASALDASAAVAGAATSTGTIAMLAPGTTNDTSLTIGLNTSEGGQLSGVAAIDLSADSGGGNVEFLSEQAIEVEGEVYREAAASIPALIVHQGDPGTLAIAIANSDPADGYSENLTATLVGASGDVNVSGSATGDIAPQATSTALGVSFPATAVGTDGTVTLDLATDGTGIDGFGVTDLGDMNLPVTVDNYAAAALVEQSGGGTWIQNGTSYSLNLGNVKQIHGPVTVDIAAENTASGPADLLSGTYDVAGNAAFTNTGFTAFSGLGSGQSESDPTITLLTGTLGTFTETVTLVPAGSNASGYSGGLADETLTVTGTVVPCFLAGTRILTDRGEVAVEDLRAGDRAVTLDGICEPIVWIGHWTLATATHSHPETVLPVRVTPAAFGHGRPSRDLYLSPDHAVFVNDVLVPVKLLIDGTRIFQVRRKRVTYYHVELPRHAVISAESLAVESYLNTSVRTDPAIRLFPAFAAPAAAWIWETRGAAKLVLGGEELERARDAMYAARSVPAILAA